MTAIDEGFTNNVGLQSMRNAWRDGWSHFELDRQGVWPLEDVLREAQTAVEINDKLHPAGSYTSPEGFTGYPMPCHPDLPSEPDSKICDICGGASRNNTCDGCYSLGRLVMADGYVQGMQDGGFHHFCVTCFDGISGGKALCEPCLELLRDAFLI